MVRPELVVLGRAAGAFGLKGELRVHSYASGPEVFMAAGLFYAGPDPKTAQPYRILSFRPQGGRLLFSVQEIQTREKAEALKGAWVYLPVGLLPSLGEDEYYWYQLKGVEVYTSGGRFMGRIQRVYHGGAHELWEVSSPEGWEAVLPIRKGVIRQMDLTAGRVEVDPPPGLLTVQGWPPEFDLQA